MYDLIYSIPDTYLFVILSCIFVIPSVACVYLVTRYIPSQARYKDNPVLGNISALISIIYGVLAGLTALYLINNISYTADAIQREANAVSNLSRDSKWLKDPAKSQIQHQIKNYVVQVIDTEWPLMEQGKRVNTADDNIIDEISMLLSQYPAKSTSETIILTEMTSELKTLYDARLQRIHMSEIELNSQIWIVIILGTILTLAINYLFGMNLYLHILSVIAVALMASSLIYLLITLDHPFQDDFLVGPGAFKSILRIMDSGENSIVLHQN